MKETIQELIGVLLTKDFFVNNTYVSFTFNLKEEKINEFDCIIFNQTSADKILESIKEQKIKSFNLKIKKVEGINKEFNFAKDWYSSSFTFYGHKPGTTKMFFECNASLISFSYDNAVRHIPHKNISVEKASKQIDILIEMILLLKNTRKKALDSIRLLKKI